MDAHAQVQTTIRRLSEAWQSRNYEQLGRLLDENVVTLMPDFSRRLDGRNALVASYREFMESSTVEEYRESPTTVHVWSNTAVAVYDWEMVWSKNGKVERESGHDLFILERHPGEDQEWLGICRIISFG